MKQLNRNISFRINLAIAFVLAVCASAIIFWEKETTIIADAGQEIKIELIQTSNIIDEPGIPAAKVMD